jgi:hypothetical protein
MNDPSVEVIIKRFESPDETRVMEKGRFELVRIGGLTIGRVTYEPGWRWSLHVAPVPHDSWVVGQEPYVSLHTLGSERYAR